MTLRYVRTYSCYSIGRIAVLEIASCDLGSQSHGQPGIAVHVCLPFAGHDCE